MIIFTCDIDWAPEEVIEYTVSTFKEANIKCTFFATHESQVLNEIENDSLFEIGIHPNFNNLLTGEIGKVENIIGELKKKYPNAVGFRSHSLFTYTHLVDMLPSFNLKYESNFYLPYESGGGLVKLWNGIIRIVHNWEDDLYLMSNKKCSFPELEMKKENLHIVAFHPIHYFLNTERTERYNMAKKFYKETDKLKSFVNKDQYGIQNIVNDFMEIVKSNNWVSTTLKEYLQNHG